MKFIYAYQEKKDLDVNSFVSSMDVTDQRSANNSPELMFQQFVVDPNTYKELDSESIESFKDDVYGYEDRSEMGVDVLTLANLADESKSNGAK